MIGSVFVYGCAILPLSRFPLIPPSIFALSVFVSYTTPLAYFYPPPLDCIQTEQLCTSRPVTRIK